MQWIALSVVVPILWTFPVGATENMSQGEELRCEIRATPQDGRVRLEAMAVAGPQASGRYQFLVVKQGGDGVTQSHQGGGFSVGAGEERVLSTTVVSAGGRDRYEATLSIEWSGQQRSCSVKSDGIQERL